MKTKKLVLLGLLSAIALTIFMLEAQLPPLLSLPGVKIGLANIVTVFTVFLLGPKEGIAVLTVRVFLGAVFAGNFSTIFYSGAGGACAIVVTILLKKVLKLNQLFVAGALGAVAHSIGQMAAAVVISISMPRSSAQPHSGISASDMMASLTPHASVETGVMMGICS